MFCYFIGLRERETWISCSTYFLGWLLRVLTGLNLQLGVRGWRPNQRSRHVTGFNAPLHPEPQLPAPPHSTSRPRHPVPVAAHSAFMVRL